MESVEGIKNFSFLLFVKADTIISITNFYNLFNTVGNTLRQALYQESVMLELTINGGKVINSYECKNICTLYRCFK